MESRESPAAPQSQQAPSSGVMVSPLHSYPPNISPNSAANNMMFQFNSVSQPLDSLNSPFADGSQSGLKPGGFTIEPTKKKRGRPRKYSPDGNIALGLSPAPVNYISSVGHADTVGHGDSTGGTPSDSTAKRNRGRPAGSGKKQLNALGSSGVGFTPHVIFVKPGEDIQSKVMAFSQQGPRTVCLLSASGVISNVTLRQPTTSGGTVTYEGRFEIISLSGSFSLSESNGNRSRTGGLSVSLAGSDGRVLGGVVAGMLMAATPVQVIVGSFIADGKKSKSGPPSAPPPNTMNFGVPEAAASPPSQEASSESSDENGSSPLNRGPGLYNNASQPVHHMPMYSNMTWANPTVKMLPN